MLWDECQIPHRGPDNMAAIFQTTLSNVFSSLEIVVFWWKFHWNLFPSVKWTLLQHWCRSWLGAWPAPSHYLNQCWLNLMTNIRVTRPQWDTTWSVFVDLTESVRCIQYIIKHSKLLQYPWRNLIATWFDILTRRFVTHFALNFATFILMISSVYHCYVYL